jgi:hypothetical protein
MLNEIGRIPIDSSSQVSVSTGNLSSISTIVPFAPQTINVVARDGSRVAFMGIEMQGQRGSFSITILGNRGDTALSRRYPFTATAVSRESADSAVEAVMRHYRLPVAGSPAIPQQAISALENKVRAQMPRYRAPVRDVMLGMDGSIWLYLGANEAGRRYMLLDAAGEPVAEFLLQPSMRFGAATAHHFWAIETDHDGLESIVRFRIEK